MGVLSADKFKPTLFVGLGGNGGKIVNLLAGKLRRHAHYDRIRSLTHFLTIDTNKDDLDKLKNVPSDCRFLISAFDRQAYIARKRGQRELPEDKLVTQWVHPAYQFRAAQGAGAGQIRIESRLGLYYNLEDDNRAGIRRKLVDVLGQATRRENPFRDEKDREVRVLLYASVAGGTGSGGFLPMAYLLRDAIRDFGWGRYNIVGVLSLPTTFLDKVKPELHADIMANGYAALKELEYLTRQLGYEGGVPEIELHYDPGAIDRSRQHVAERPFSIAYLIDRPSQVSIERYEQAVADASFLQIYSPILGAQAGEYDNYDKHQKTLALGAYAVHYAALGTALLHLPRRDLVRYAGLRFVGRAFREFLCFGGDDPQFRVPWGSPAFERLDPAEKNRIADEKFESYVAYRAGLEEQVDEKGVFRAIHGQTGTGGKPLRRSFAEALGFVYGRLDELVQIPDIEPQAINQGNPSLSRPIDELRRSYAESKARVRAYLEAQMTELRTGRMLGRFFKDNEVNPIAQRLFLIRLAREGFVVPFEDPADGEFLKSDGGPRADLDSNVVQDEIKRLEGELVKAANPGFLGSVIDRDNKAFQGAKLRATRKYAELAQDHREELRRYFWRAFEAELRQVATTLLSSFRKVAEVADESSRLVDAETESFRKDPAANPDSDVAQYYLDMEALRDDRRGERLWHLYYEHHLDRGAFFDARRIFSVVTAAFMPAQDSDGRLRERGATEIVAAARGELEKMATEMYTQALVDLRLDLASALDAEQRYIALLDQGADFKVLRRDGKLDEAMGRVPADVVQRGIEDKLSRLSAECALLAHIDDTRSSDPTVTPARVFVAGLAAAYDTGERGSLASILRDVASGVSLVTGWEDRDALVLYRALLGVPAYFFRNVEQQLYPAYRRVRDRDNRSYPLHIEAAWETTKEQPGLPNLDPLELKQAREREAAEREARARADAKTARVRAFTAAMLGGAIVDEGGDLSWSYAGAKAKLGASRSSAFMAFEALDPQLRGDLEEIGARYIDEKRAERRTRDQLRDEARALLERAKGAFAKALAEGNDGEKRFIGEQRTVLEALIAELSG